jgi:hypothetical protein
MNCVRSGLAAEMVALAASQLCEQALFDGCHGTYIDASPAQVTAIRARIHRNLPGRQSKGVDRREARFTRDAIPQIDGEARIACP